jgi:BirA family biotin operon repressor/biotin-[acetyl-CoA-carboxylase] ligase
MPFDLVRVRQSLACARVEWHACVDSTMFEASRLAREGAPSGTIVGADEQTAGHGRYGRTWHSEAEAGLYVSFVLRHRFSSSSVPVVTLALGLAAADAILKSTDQACDLRWPNDLLLQAKKCGGILTELEDSAIIAGIGINVNQSAFPSEISECATSLRQVTGRPHSRENLLIELALSVDQYCALLQSEGKEPILEMFSRSSSFVRGRRVDVDLGDSVLRGTTAGLNASGFLILRGDDGVENVILAGGVRPCS